MREPSFQWCNGLTNARVEETDGDSILSHDVITYTLAMPWPSAHRITGILKHKQKRVCSALPPSCSLPWSPYTMSKLGQKREQTKTTGALETEQPSTIPKIFIRRNQNARGREPHSRCGSMHSFAMKWPDAATPPRPAPPRLPLPLPTLPTLVNLPPTPASFDADLCMSPES